MADPYDSAKAGRLTFKGAKSIDKNKKKKKNIKPKQQHSPDLLLPVQDKEEEEEVENIYTIDAAKKMNYQDLFPVEAKKFGYVPNHNNKDKAKKAEESSSSTVEAALDDRVKKKADRYCK